MREEKGERVKMMYNARHFNVMEHHPNNTGSYDLWFCILFHLAFVDTCLCLVLIYLSFEQS